MYSKERALELFNRYLSLVTSQYGTYIEAILLVGSLTNDSYLQGPGRDIDQITILKDDAPSAIRDCILNCITKLEHETNREIPLAKTVYHHHQLQRPFDDAFEKDVKNKHLLEVTIELQRIHESGIVFYGDPSITQKIAVPTRDEALRFAEIRRSFDRQVRQSHPQINQLLNAPTVRIAVQIFLTSAIQHYYFATGEVCSNKHLIADKVDEHLHDYRYLKALLLAKTIKLNPDITLTSHERTFLIQECISLIAWKGDHTSDIIPYK